MESRVLLAKPAFPQKGSDHLRPFTPRVRHTRAQLVASGLRHAIPWNFSDVSLLASDESSRPASTPPMATLLQSKPDVAPPARFARQLPLGKCNCGGKCESCRPTPSSHTTALLQVPEDSPLGTDDDDGVAVDLGGSHTTEQNGDGLDGGQGEQDSADSGGGSLQITVGSGGPLCFNGGGSSACNLSSGEYTIRSNDNTCCTKDCTQQHEATHVKDITGWGCCKRASAAYTQSASPGKVAEMYNTWLERARALTECHAYTNDVTCATAMQKSNDCNGKGKDSACCLSILSYKNRYSDEAKNYCKIAPAKAPACPNFDLATVLP